jgi:hypothetical protein
MNLQAKRSTAILIVLVIITCTGNSQTFMQNKQNSAFAHDSTFISNLVSSYARSIDEADTTLGSRIWAHTADVSFINPRGNEYGWNGVKNIYQMFKDNFTDRSLTFHNLKFSIYDDVLWLEFFWTFNAKMRSDNAPIQTKGRETQIWKKVNTEWRLVHVHYSGMPVTGQGEGF